MGIFNLITLILNIVEPALNAAGVIPTSAQPLAAGLLGAISQVKQDFTSTTTGNFNFSTVSLLQAIASGLQALVTAKAIDPIWGGVATALATAATSGAAAYAQTGNVINPTNLQPIAPVA